ncbi:MAG TPA: Fis family transcriptional regulator [Candidatus Accumulibacter sp.]|nr:SoxR reducing system RseC family protein [Accumulibacter sp.]HCZ14828.1 Fis family transcriptional regulator [Accumulibacter sp.]
MNKEITMIRLSDRNSVEGVVRVVEVQDGVIWLQPEQTSTCGSCASAGQCGKGIGSLARRNEARRFSIAHQNGLGVGERIVVGVAPRILVKAALIAYGLPLTTALAAAGIAQSWFGGDLATLLAAATGLACGLWMARLGARRLSASGELAPRFLRRAQPGESDGGKSES